MNKTTPCDLFSSSQFFEYPALMNLYRQAWEYEDEIALAADRIFIKDQASFLKRTYYVAIAIFHRFALCFKAYRQKHENAAAKVTSAIGQKVQAIKENVLARRFCATWNRKAQQNKKERSIIGEFLTRAIEKAQQQLKTLEKSLGKLEVDHHQIKSEIKVLELQKENQLLRQKLEESNTSTRRRPTDEQIPTPQQDPDLDEAKLKSKKEAKSRNERELVPTRESRDKCLGEIKAYEKLLTGLRKEPKHIPAPEQSASPNSAAQPTITPPTIVDTKQKSQPIEPIASAPKVSPLFSDLKSATNEKMSNLWKGLFDKYKIGIKQWSCDRASKAFTLELSAPLQFWVPKREGTDDPDKGAVLILAQKITGALHKNKIEFTAGFTSCVYKGPILFNPFFFSLTLKEESIDLHAGTSKLFSQTRTKPLSTLHEDWIDKSQLVEGGPQAFLDAQKPS